MKDYFNVNIVEGFKENMNKIIKEIYKQIEGTFIEHLLCIVLLPFIGAYYFYKQI